VHPPSEQRKDFDPAIRNKGGGGVRRCYASALAKLAKQKETPYVGHSGPRSTFGAPIIVCPCSKKQSLAIAPAMRPVPPYVQERRTSSEDNLSARENDVVEGGDSDYTLSNYVAMSNPTSVQERRGRRRQEPLSSDSTLWEDDYQMSLAGVATDREAYVDIGEDGRPDEEDTTGRGGG
jgi:hypothetical protein